MVPKMPAPLRRGLGSLGQLDLGCDGAQDARTTGEGFNEPTGHHTALMLSLPVHKVVDKRFDRG